VSYNSQLPPISAFPVYFVVDFVGSKLYFSFSFYRFKFTTFDAAKIVIMIMAPVIITKFENLLSLSNVCPSSSAEEYPPSS